jgi:hypothetical protein
MKNPDPDPNLLKSLDSVNPIPRHHLPELCIEGILIANQARSGLEGHTHCNGNPIYVLPEKELCGLSPNFHIHVSVNDLYIPRIGPHIFLH